MQYIATRLSPSPSPLSPSQQFLSPLLYEYVVGCGTRVGVGDTYSLHLKIIIHLKFKIYSKKNITLTQLPYIKKEYLKSSKKKRRHYPNISDKRQDNIRILLTKDKRYFIISHQILVCVYGLRCANIMGRMEYARADVAKSTHAAL